ncbi:Tetratricopeptide repeat protein 1 [Senna tora]|uniref:Protein unc-45 homolog B n=1 Tax=Senna tora TaxID=362788 RepID=A0A834TYC3_9FABA|nr:Tetratricopeptide repeat protein 1 [Senna tora]
MDSLVNKKSLINLNPFPKTSDDDDQFCTTAYCFFCSMKEADVSLRRSRIANCFKHIPLTDHPQHVLVLSGLWTISMAQPNNPEFPSLGIFHCMATLIHKAITHPHWLLHHHNIYIPYYAAHIIGSLTINQEHFAQIAVQSGVIPPLLQLLRGQITWVEQRVAVRALGHLASYGTTFQSLADYGQEVVNLAINLASTCLELVYVQFVGVKDVNKRLKYHRELMTRGIHGDLELENRKAEEWASQLQCWSLHLLNCFASKERGLDVICANMEFLEDLCHMWGGLVNQTSPAGVGLIRVLCYTKLGRKTIAQSPKIIKSLGNLSRSSDDWQYMGIHCLLLLLKDVDTRYKVFDIAASYLIDLIDLTSLRDKSKVGEAITNVLLLEYKHSNKLMRLNRHKVDQKPLLRQVLDLKVDRWKKERVISEEKLEEKRVLVSLIKQQANHKLCLGEIEGALRKYSEALDTCPLKYRKERMVLYSKRAQCHLLLNDPDPAISDSTRALCLSNPVNTHRKSLWRRSHAYDMKGLAKESLMDYVMFINITGCAKSDINPKRVKIPYDAVRMICKQMEATWLFAIPRSKAAQKESKDRLLFAQQRIQFRWVEMMKWKGKVWDENVKKNELVALKLEEIGDWWFVEVMLGGESL